MTNEQIAEALNRWIDQFRAIAEANPELEEQSHDLADKMAEVLEIVNARSVQ